MTIVALISPSRLLTLRTTNDDSASSCLPLTTFPSETRQPRREPQRRIPTTVLLSMTSLDVFDTSPLLVAGLALGLGIGAQGFINQMLDGDEGLGAFLRDGSGYNKSGFRPITNQPSTKSDDPLPWLKLPQLDFVEVAGQPSRREEEALMKKLESMRTEMNNLLDQGKIEEAQLIQEDLEVWMEESGIQFTADR